MTIAVMQKGEKMLAKDTKVKIVMHWEDEEGVKRPVAELDNIDFETVDKVLNELEYMRVVRCKDCKHRPVMEWSKVYDDFDVLAPEVDGEEDWRCPCLIKDDPYYSWSPNDNWFCANGERRGEDGTD